MHRRFALGALIITILTAAATSTATLLEISDDVAIIRQGAKIPDADRFLDDVDAGKPQTILLLGSDRRYVDRNDKSAARSDTILLIRLDPSKEATAVLSIPRDLMVDIPATGARRSTRPTRPAARTRPSRRSSRCSTSRSTTSST